MDISLSMYATIKFNSDPITVGPVLRGAYCNAKMRIWKREAAERNASSRLRAPAFSVVALEQQCWDVGLGLGQ